MRSTRGQYGPPLSIVTDSSPPMAGSSASSRRPVANPTAIGTHSASTASAIAPHGTGAFFGRITSASQSGTTPLSQSGTASRAPPASRAPLTLHTRSKARDKRQKTDSSERVRGSTPTQPPLLSRVNRRDTLGRPLARHRWYLARREGRRRACHICTTSTRRDASVL